MTCNCGNQLAIGALQRQDPLPIGTYWIDVIDTQHQQDFAAWLVLNAKTVKVLNSEHFPENDWPDCSSLDPTTGGCWPSRDWVKFEVSAPTKWDAVEFGFPNIIKPSEKIETSADTASNPDFSDNCDIGCQMQKAAIAVGVMAVGVIAIAVAVRK